MKKRLQRPTPEDDERSYKGFREEFDDSRFAKKSDQYLKNASKGWDDYTPREKRNIKRNLGTSLGAFTLGTTGIGYELAKAYGKSKTKGALIGAGLGTLGSLGILAGGIHHRKHVAKKAKEELEKRQKGFSFLRGDITLSQLLEDQREFTRAGKKLRRSSITSS